MSTVKSTNMPRPKFSNDDYMEKRCTHREYYGQFVTPGIRWAVENRIGLDRLMASKDEHLNDIPLAEWDGLAEEVGRYALSVRGELSDNRLSYSLAGAVCILKEAARQLIDEAKGAQAK